jgi:hypothetical protein
MKRDMADDKLGLTGTSSGAQPAGGGDAQTAGSWQAEVAKYKQNVQTADAGQGQQVNTGAKGSKLQPQSSGAGAQQPPQNSKSCGVVSGPRHEYNGTLSHPGNDRQAGFYFTARFANDATHDPSCCEFHQDIKWDQTFAQTHQGPPHSGFGNAPAGVFVEDVSPSGDHYGDRNNSYAGNQYTSHSKLDPKNGDTYFGMDFPEVGPRERGQYEFRGRVTDSCHGNAPVATGNTITIDWNKK